MSSDMSAYQRSRINSFILYIIMRITIRHPWRNNGHRQFELGGDTEEWMDICVIQLGPDVHFFEKFLLKDQSVIER